MRAVEVIVDIQEYTRYLTYFIAKDALGVPDPGWNDDIESDWHSLCSPGLSGLHVLVDRVGRAMEGRVADFERAMVISTVLASRGNAQDRSPWYELYQDNPMDVIAVGIELTASTLSGYARFVYHFCETIADAATIEGFPLVYIRTMAGADETAVSRYRRERALSRVESRVTPRINVNLNATDFDGIHPSPETQAAFNRALAGMLEGQTSVRLASLLTSDQKQVDFLAYGSSSPDLETPPEPKIQSGRRLKRTKPTTPKEESNDVTHNFDQSSKDPVNQRFARRARRSEQARHSDDPS